MLKDELSIFFIIYVFKDSLMIQEMHSKPFCKKKYVLEKRNNEKENSDKNREYN